MQINELEFILQAKSKEKEKILTEICNIVSQEQQTVQKIKSKNEPTQKDRDLYKILSFLDGIKVISHCSEENKITFSVSSCSKVTVLSVFFENDMIDRIEWKVPSERLEIISNYAIENNNFDFLVREIHGMHFE